jgi:hypothetical protein
MYLLDTNVVIDFWRRDTAVVAMMQQFDRQGEDLCTCDIIVAELYSGLRPANRAQAATLIQSLIYLDVPLAAAEQAGLWRYDFARQGVTLATTDTVIAAVAQFYDATVVTRNVAHFPMTGISIQAP